MKNFFVKGDRKILLAAGLVTLGVAVNLLAAGRISLFPSYLAGYLLGAAYFFTATLRLKRAAGLNKTSAKREMLIGLVLRLLMMFVVLGAALQISQSVFMTVATGFGVFYVLFLAHLILAAFRQNILP